MRRKLSADPIEPPAPVTRMPASLSGNRQLAVGTGSGGRRRKGCQSSCRLAEAVIGRKCTLKVYRGKDGLRRLEFSVAQRVRVRRSRMWGKFETIRR